MTKQFLLMILAVVGAVVGVLYFFVGWAALFVEESLQAAVLFAVSILALIASGIAWRRSGRRLW